jgi:hypothetical protein
MAESVLVSLLCRREAAQHFYVSPSLWNNIQQFNNKAHNGTRPWASLIHLWHSQALMHPKLYSNFLLSLRSGLLATLLTKILFALIFLSS